jgi:predicted RNase H-like HicB family nuclease
MHTTYYPAIIDKGEKNFGVMFPDFLGCVSVGDTVQEAARNAEVALNAHIELMVKDGDEIPEPSDLDNIEDDPEIEEVARVLVRAELESRVVRLNITFGESLLSQVDVASKSLGMSRSGYLAEAARRMLGGR